MKFILILSNLVSSKVYSSCQKSGQVALTYDDGPSPYTGTLLNVLKEADVKAAFHFVGDYLDTPYVAAYVREAAENGHLIGLNSKVDISKVKPNDNEYFDELMDLQSSIEELVGFKPKYLRVPYSSKYPEQMVNKLEDMGFVLTVHNLDSQDYLYSQRTNDKDSVFNNVKAQVENIVPPAKGSFILVQHDQIASSVNQADLIIDYLKSKNYEIVRLDEAIGKTDPKGFTKTENKPEGSLKGNKKSSATSIVNPSLILLLGIVFSMF